MKRLSLSTGLVAAAMALSAAPLLAAPFTCPTRGGDLVFGQEANVNSLDQMTSSTISTRNIAMNIYETLITRDENNKPIPELAESMQESPDGMSYTFKLRQGTRVEAVIDAVESLDADTGISVTYPSDCRDCTLAVEGVDIDTIPVEGQVLFIGLLFLGTLAISRFSIQVGVPAILGVLVLGLAININYLDITHQQAESLHVFALAW